MITGPALFFITILVLYCTKKFLKGNTLFISPTQEGGYRCEFQEKQD
jgi:hypothetical protein